MSAGNFFFFSFGAAVIAAIWALWKPTIQPWLSDQWARFKARL